MFSQLLTAPSRFWTLGPQLAGTIFDARLAPGADRRRARAAYDQDVAIYRQTVLAAFQDVEDNLASQRILEQEIVVQQQAVDSARQALAIVTNEYKAGTVGYVNVLTAQTTAFTAEQKLDSIAGERMVSSVGLVKALGGGWDVSQMARETGDVAAPAPCRHRVCLRQRWRRPQPARKKPRAIGASRTFSKRLRHPTRQRTQERTAGNAKQKGHGRVRGHAPLSLTRPTAPSWRTSVHESQAPPCPARSAVPSRFSRPARLSRASGAALAVPLKRRRRPPTPCRCRSASTAPFSVGQIDRGRSRPAPETPPGTSPAA